MNDISNKQEKSKKKNVKKASMDGEDRFIGDLLMDDKEL